MTYSKYPDMRIDFPKAGFSTRLPKETMIYSWSNKINKTVRNWGKDMTEVVRPLQESTLDNNFRTNPSKTEGTDLQHTCSCRERYS